MSENDPHPPLSRRVFVFDLLALGAGVLGSIAWVWSTRHADASPVAASSTTPKPRETDQVQKEGGVRHPASRGKPSSAPTCGKPGEHDKMPLAGEPVAPVRTPKPPEHDRIPMAGAPLPPPATPSPKPSPKATETDHSRPAGRVAAPSSPKPNR